MVTDDLLFIYFSAFSPLPNAPKITRLCKIYILTWKYSLSEGNFGPSGRDTIGHLPLYTMADNSECFTMLTNNISSDPIPNMVVVFLLGTLH